MNDDPSFPTSPRPETPGPGDATLSSWPTPPREPNTPTGASPGGGRPPADGPPAPQPLTPEPPRRQGSARQWVLGAVVGGLCGALVASGFFYATDDDGSSKSSSGAPNPVVVNPAAQSRVAQNGNIQAILAKDVPAIVKINTGSANGTGTGATSDSGGGAGTGFVIASDGTVVTNNHVVADPQDPTQVEPKIDVVFSSGKTSKAKVLGRDVQADIAVIKVDDTNVPTIELGDSDTAKVGDDVVAIGNALALEGGLSVTRGIISGLNRDLSQEIGAQLDHVIQTDAAINPGNSGGPLVDAQGKVIGINVAVSSQGQNVGFAIPISSVKPIIDDLRAGRKPAFLGVRSETVTAALAKQLNLKADSGAVVRDVTRGAPAQQAGIKQNDVIVDIGGTAIKTNTDVQEAVRKHRPGEKVTVVVNRDGNQMSIDVTLTERPDSG